MASLTVVFYNISLLMSTPRRRGQIIGLRFWCCFSAANLHFISWIYFQFLLVYYHQASKGNIQSVNGVAVPCSVRSVEKKSPIGQSSAVIAAAGFRIWMNRRFAKGHGGAGGCGRSTGIRRPGCSRRSAHGVDRGRRLRRILWRESDKRALQLCCSSAVL